MTKPVNLRRARKQKARDARARGAEASRAREGQTGAERKAQAKRAALRARLLEGARRDIKPT